MIHRLRHWLRLNKSVSIIYNCPMSDTLRPARMCLECGEIEL